jgi:glycosyltransferase involved in cell wall biosynthesis
LKILHVTESMATGVLEVLAQMAEHQAELGHEVEVAYVPHPDGPSAAEIRERLCSVSTIHVRGRRDAPRLTRSLALFKLMLPLLRRREWDVVHLHSSIAGVIGRSIPTGVPLVYSPHGYAFLRRDVSPLSARLYRYAERRLRHRAVTLCVSSAELAVAERALGADAHVIPNVLPRRDIEALERTPVQDRKVVVNIGRWGPQKAPERFTRAAMRYHDRADFRWIGLGESDAHSRWTVTGWLNQAGVWKELASADIIYFTSRWEGMPVGLMQAQAAGVPAIAMECVGVRDVIMDGVTGYVLEDEETAQDYLCRLLNDENELEQLRRAAIARRLRFADDAYGEDLILFYARTVAKHG